MAGEEEREEGGQVWLWGPGRERIKESHLKMHVSFPLSTLVFVCSSTLQYSLTAPVPAYKELFRLPAVCLSPIEPAVLSPDLGLTKQSPYPLLWEHEVKGIATYDRHLLTSRPLSLFIHMNHYRLHVADKDTTVLKYIIHRMHSPVGQHPHKVLWEEKKSLWFIQHSAITKHLTSQAVQLKNESLVTRVKNKYLL